MSKELKEYFNEKLNLILNEFNENNDGSNNRAIKILFDVYLAGGLSQIDKEAL